MMNIDSVLKSHGIGIGTNNGAGVKNVQRIIGNFEENKANEKTYTISNVIEKNTVVYVRNISSLSPNPAVKSVLYSVELIDTATVKIKVHQPISSTFEINVVEFNELKSKQTISTTSTYPNNYHGTIALPNVNVNKCIVIPTWTTEGSNNDVNQIFFISYKNFTSTSIELYGSYYNKINWQIIEFK